MYTYVFENKEYEVALNNVKAILFDIVTKEEEKLTALSEKAEKSGDANLQQSFNELRSEQDDCLKLVLSISNQLAETLKKLDSYSRELRHIEDKNIAEIIANMTVSNPNVDISIKDNSNDLGNNNVDYVSSFNNVEMNNTPTTNVSAPVENFSNVSNNVGDSNVAQPMVTPALRNVVEEVIPYDDSLSNVVEEVVEYVPEEVPANVGAVEVINEEVIPYDDSLSNVVEEVVEYVPEEAPVSVETNNGEVVVEAVMPYDDEISTVSVEGEANTNASNGEVVEEVMPYDDEISTVSAEGEASTTVSNGEAVEEVMPYDDEISTVSAEGEANTNASNGEAVEEVMPYDDEISTVSAEGEANTNASNGEAVEEVMPYDDEISTVSAEGEASTTASNGEAVEEVMPYDDEISTVSAEGEASTNASNGEVVEEVMPYDDEISTVSTEGEANTDTSSEEKSNESTELIPTNEESNSSVKLVIPGTEEVANENTNSNNNEVLEESKPAIQLVIPGVNNNNNNNTSENVDNTVEETTNSPLIIPTGNTSSDSENTLDPALEAVLNDDNKNNSKVVDILVFKKRTNDLAKAILTTSKQNTNLRGSLATQEALLKARGFFDNLNEASLEKQLVANGLLPGDANAQIEQMMNQANELYTAGKVEEAQAMYDKISELNKQVQSSEAKVA